MKLVLIIGALVSLLGGNYAISQWAAQAPNLQGNTQVIQGSSPRLQTTVSSNYLQPANVVLQ